MLELYTLLENKSIIITGTLKTLTFDEIPKELPRIIYDIYYSI